MAEFYTGLASTAQSLLIKFGQAVTLTRRTTSFFDPYEGVEAYTETSITGYGAAFDYATNEIDGATIQAGDVKMLLNAVSTSPAPGDTWTSGADVWQVVDVKRMAPSGTVVAYELRLRK